MRPRSSVITSTVTLLLAASVVVGTPAAGGPGWPQAGYDGGSSRFNPREWRLDPPAVRQLKPEWRTSLRLEGEYVYEHIRVGAVREGRVFASWEGESNPYRGHVVALSLDRGRILWRLRWPGEPRAANARTVFAQVGSRTVALDVATGERRWRRDASHFLTATDDVRRLFLSEGDDVVAVRASDGAEIWRRSVGDLGGPAFLVDGVLALNAGDRTTTILALDATDGRPLWHRHTPARALSYLQAGGGGRLYLRVEVGEASIVQVRSARDGTALWRRRFPDGPYGGMIRVGAVAPRFAFVTVYRCMEPDVYECSGVVGRLFALEPRSGKTRWSISGAQGSVRAGPVWYADAVANGSVYVSGVRGRRIALAALAVETGRVRWSSSVPGRYGSISAVADGWVIAASSGAGAVPPGSKVWAFTAPVGSSSRHV